MIVSRRFSVSCSLPSTFTVSRSWTIMSIAFSGSPEDRPSTARRSGAVTACERPILAEATNASAAAITKRSLVAPTSVSRRAASSARVASSICTRLRGLRFLRALVLQVHVGDARRGLGVERRALVDEVDDLLGLAAGVGVGLHAAFGLALAPRLRGFALVIGVRAVDHLLAFGLVARALLLVAFGERVDRLVEDVGEAGVPQARDQVVLGREILSRIDA